MMNSHLVFAIVAVAYLSLVSFTDFSLVGIWPDLVFAFLALTILLKVVFKGNQKKDWLALAMRILALATILLSSTLFMQRLNIPWGLSKVKTTSFLYRRIGGRLFNAYFTPVGSYSGGEGDLWITETSHYFPCVEYPIYYKHAVLWDFSVEEWDGQVTDQDKIVRNYIESKIIEKEQGNSVEVIE